MLVFLGKPRKLGPIASQRCQMQIFSNGVITRAGGQRQGSCHWLFLASWGWVTDWNIIITPEAILNTPHMWMVFLIPHVLPIAGSQTEAVEGAGRRQKACSRSLAEDQGLARRSKAFLFFAKGCYLHRRSARLKSEDRNIEICQEPKVAKGCPSESAESCICPVPLEVPELPPGDNQEAEQLTHQG